MTADSSRATLAYAILVAVGVLGAVADILVSKWAGGAGNRWLGYALPVGASVLVLFGLFLRLERYSFAAAVVLVAVVHLAVDFAWDVLANEVRPTWLEAAGLALGVAAVVVLELGRRGSAVPE